MDGRICTKYSRTTLSNSLLRISIVLLVVLSGVEKAFPQNAISDTLTTGILKNMSLEALMNIEVVSVSRHPEKLRESPSAIQVVTGEDIHGSGASTIPEALRLADNLQVAQKGSAGWGISARGFNTSLANKLLVLIDGRTVYTPLYSGVFWDRQDYLLEDIDRIEVVSGPGGTQWGANAVNGVINIITKSSKDTKGFYIETGGGTTLKDFIGGRYGGSLGSEGFYRVYAKYSDHGSQVFSNGNNALDSWHMIQGGFRIDDELSSQNTTTIHGDIYRNAQNQASGDASKTVGGNIVGRWSHNFTSGSTMDVQLYYDRTELSLPTAPFVVGSTVVAPAGVLNDNLDTYDIDFQHRVRFTENNNFTWGFGYRRTHDVVHNSPAIGFFPATLDQNLFNGFLQDQVSLGENLLFTIGSKLEHNDYTGLEVEPSARVQWNFTGESMVWAGVSRAVRTPSRIDRDLNEPTPPNYLFSAPLPPVLLLVGGSDFKSESVVAYECGYRARIAEDIVMSVSAFYNSYNNIRSTDTTSGGFFTLPLYFANDLEAETYGFELGMTYQLFPWWRVRTGYNLLKEHVRAKPGRFDYNNEMNETADPENQFSLHSLVTLSDGVVIDGSLRWVDVLHNNNAAVPGNVPPYTELTIRAGWKIIETTEISVVGQNLLHDHHPEYGFPNSMREEIRRGVYGKISFSM